MKKGISFCGKICSGKTQLTTMFCKKYSWSRISFGDYLRHILTQEGQSISRENLQRKGAEIINSGEFEWFLEEVIKYNNPNSNIHVFDSIRNIRMIEVAKNYYDIFTTVCIEVDDTIRHKRYNEKYGLIEYEKFIKLSNDPVEINLEKLRKISNIIVYNEGNVEDVFYQVDEKIRQFGYI